MEGLKVKVIFGVVANGGENPLIISEKGYSSDSNLNTLPSPESNGIHSKLPVLEMNCS